MQEEGVNMDNHIYIRLPADNVKEGPIPNTYIVDLGPADTLMMMVLGAMANPGKAAVLNKEEE